MIYIIVLEGRLSPSSDIREMNCVKLMAEAESHTVPRSSGGGGED